MMRAAAKLRRNTGFTLIELMVVLVLIGIMAAAIIPEMRGSFEGALLRSTSRQLLGVLDLAYSRSISMNLEHRVRFDFKTSRYAIERKSSRSQGSNSSGFAPVRDGAGCDGAWDPRIALELKHPEEEQSEDAAPQDAPADPQERQRSDSGATISFYPDGAADPAEIILRDRDGFRLALRISKATARVQIVEMERK